MSKATEAMNQLSNSVLTQRSGLLCKTAIYGNHAAGWSLYLHENGCYEWLIGSDITGSSSGALDVISLLGHNLCLMSWQKLIFCSEGQACTAVSYIRLPGIPGVD